MATSKQPPKPMSPSLDPLKVYTLAEAAELVRLDDKTLRRAIKKGQLAAAQNMPGGKLFIYEDDLKTWQLSKRISTGNEIRAAIGLGMVPLEIGNQRKHRRFVGTPIVPNLMHHVEDALSQVFQTEP